MAKIKAASFKYAIEGIITALKDQPNIKFHFFAAGIAVLLGLYFKITTIEWFMVVIAIGMVISLELTNTAIEELVNAFTLETHPSAKKAKDVAAGAVLSVSIVALVIGLIVFLPYVFNLKS